MQEWVISIMNIYGYWGVMLLIAIENIFPPIPSEVILTFGGFMTTVENADMKVWMVILFATIGSVCGAVILYIVGRILDTKRIERIVDKWGSILHLKTKDVQKAEDWFNRFGGLTVFFCRFIPIIRSLISIPAGMAKMRFTSFLLLTTIGTAIWNVVLVNLGAFAGDNWKTVANYIATYSNITLAILIIATVAFLIWFSFVIITKSGSLNRFKK